MLRIRVAELFSGLFYVAASRFNSPHHCQTVLKHRGFGSVKPSLLKIGWQSVDRGQEYETYSAYMTYSADH